MRIERIGNGCRQGVSAALAAFALCAAGSVSAAEVTLLRGDGGFAGSSFEAAGNWSDGAAPASGNDYVVALGKGAENALWIPGVYRQTKTFAGDSLTVGASGVEGAVRLSSAWDATLNFTRLALHSGELLFSQQGNLNGGAVEATAANPFRFLAAKGCSYGVWSVPLSGSETAAVFVGHEAASEKTFNVGLGGNNYLGKAIYDGANGPVECALPNFGANRASVLDGGIDVRNGATFMLNDSGNRGQVSRSYAKQTWVVDGHGTTVRSAGTSYALSKSVCLYYWNVTSSGDIKFSDTSDGYETSPLERGFLLVGDKNKVGGSITTTGDLWALRKTLVSVADCYAISEGTLVHVEEGATWAMSADRLRNYKFDVNGGYLHAGTYSFYGGVHDHAANPELCPILHAGVPAATLPAGNHAIGWYSYPRPATSSEGIGTETALLKNTTFRSGGVKVDVTVRDGVAQADCFTLDESCVIAGKIAIFTTTAMSLTDRAAKRGYTVLRIPTSVKTVTPDDFDVSRCYFDTDDGRDPDGVYTVGVRVSTDADGLQAVSVFRRSKLGLSLIIR